MVVVYDVTNESSFLNARHWLLSAKEAVCGGVGGYTARPSSPNHDDDEAVDQTVFILMANKVDLADDDVLR